MSKRKSEMTIRDLAALAEAVAVCNDKTAMIPSKGWKAAAERLRKVGLLEFDLNTAESHAYCPTLLGRQTAVILVHALKALARK